MPVTARPTMNRVHVVPNVYVEISLSLLPSPRTTAFPFKTFVLNKGCCTPFACTAWRALPLESVQLETGSLSARLSASALSQISKPERSVGNMLMVMLSRFHALSFLPPLGAPQEIQAVLGLS